MGVKLRWKILKNGDKSAYLDIYQNRKRNYDFLEIYVRKSDTSERRKECKLYAETIRAQREIEIQASNYNFVPSHKKKIDFLKYYTQFVETYKKKDVRKASSSLDKFKNYLDCEDKSFARITGTLDSKGLQFLNVTPKLCEGFKDYLVSPISGLSGETSYDYWKQFKAVLRDAKGDGILTTSPAEGIVFKGSAIQKDRMAKDVLTTEELQALAKAYCGNTEVKRAFLVACYTGIGLAEARNLTWRAVTSNKFTYTRGKTNRQVILDLHPTLLKLLGEKEKPTDKVFKNLPSGTAMAKLFNNWVKKAGFEKKITFYCGRHTFATRLLLNGANLKTVADLMGHTTTKHTLKYLNYVDSLRTDAINNLPSLEL